MHQSFKSTGIVCKPGDEFVGLHRFWHQNSSCEAFDRQIGGVENGGAADCAQANGARVVLPAASAMPPATNSRRRILHPICALVPKRSALPDCPGVLHGKQVKETKIGRI